MVMEAIIASGTPDADSGRNFDGDSATDTYQEVIQEMIDMYAWGQYDHATVGGGWRYGWNQWSDNSANQWAAIGMIPAEITPAHTAPGPDGILGTADDVVIDYWGIVPQWVKDRNNVFLNYTYYNGAPSVASPRFGYTNTNYVNYYGIATRPSGMVQMVMSSPNYKTDARWINNEGWFANNWNWFIGHRTYYGWYAFVKAMRLSNTETLSSGFDWYRGSNGIANKLLSEQSSAGHWPSGGQVTHPGYYGNVFVTAWAISMLKPALFAAAPSSCFSAAPNPTYPNQDIVFDPSCSDHSETGRDINNLTLFEWDWDNDGTYDEDSASPTTATNAFVCGTLPCTYPVTLRVTDDSTPAVIKFLERSQNLPSHNDQSWASDDPQNKGGFVYFPGNSKAGEAKLPSGKTVVRSYGSMSYAGLLSYIYADMDRDDPRVKGVFDWLQSFYTLEENPGMGAEGLYYYYHTMAKALSIYGVDELVLKDGRKVNWRKDLALKFLDLQNADGSWVNTSGRWWERDPVLVTSYAVIAMEIIYRGL